MGKERGWKIRKKPKLVIIEGTKNSQNEKEKNKKIDTRNA